MKLVENIPVDTHSIERLIPDRDDLYLTWPAAKFPFDHRQWLEVLNPDEGNRPFFIYKGDEIVGHAALRKTETPGLYAVCFLYLLPDKRSKGLGTKMMALLEDYARKELLANRLVLKTRTYNPRAVRCYEKAGYKQVTRDNTLILMSKTLNPA